MRKFISSIVAISLLIGILSLNAFASEVPSADSLTIQYGSMQTNSVSSSSSGTVILNQSEVEKFFEEHELNYDYYSQWIDPEKNGAAASVTITVTNAIPYNGSIAGISGSRIVYTDVVSMEDPKDVQLTPGTLMSNAVSEVISFTIGKWNPLIASLASILGLTDPESYFGSNRVQIGDDYYRYEGSTRTVTKIVELYAPVSGMGTIWYGWGYAQCDYVRTGVQVYYKGAPLQPMDNTYHKYYTEHYYLEDALKTLVMAAYPNSEYREIADPTTAEINGYEIYDSATTVSGYLEYASECQ